MNHHVRAGNSSWDIHKCNKSSLTIELSLEAPLFISACNFIYILHIQTHTQTHTKRTKHRSLHKIIVTFYILSMGNVCPSLLNCQHISLCPLLFINKCNVPLSEPSFCCCCCFYTVSNIASQGSNYNYTITFF